MKNRNFFLGLFLSLIMLSPIFVQAAGGAGGEGGILPLTNLECGSVDSTFGPVSAAYCNQVAVNLLPYCKSPRSEFNTLGTSLCRVTASSCKGIDCAGVSSLVQAAQKEYNDKIKASGGGGGGGGVAEASTAKISNPMTTATSSPQAFIGKIINAVMGIVGSLALLMFILGGLIWMTSAGSPEKVKKGRDIVIWSVLGLVVVFASYELVSFLIKNVK